MSMDDDKSLATETPETAPGHWQLLRDVIVFQLKLALDSVRDLLLSPVSIVAAIVGLIAKPDNPGVHFYRVLKLGHRSDKWINLFGSEEHGDSSSDEYVRKVEELIVGEYNKGGVVKRVKDSTDELIDKVRRPRD